MRLGITEFIDCAHFLPDHPKCGRLHGHTYKLELVIEADPIPGMIMDFADMKNILRTVCHEFDHRSWNEVLDFPTVENICILIAHRLADRLKHPFRLRVWEGHGKWAEIRAPEELDRISMESLLSSAEHL